MGYTRLVVENLPLYLGEGFPGAFTRITHVVPNSDELL